MIDFQYGVSPANPTHRFDRQQAQQRALWRSYHFFLDRADRFVLTYWLEDDRMAPLLLTGLEPQPSPASPQCRQLDGALTAERFALIRGTGEGEFPWWSVALFRGEQPIYYILEHETVAQWNATPQEVQALCAAGVDPSVVEDLAEERRLAQAQWAGAPGLERLAAAICRTLIPGATGYAYGSDRPSEAPDRVFASIGQSRDQVYLEYDPAASALIADLPAAEALVKALEPPLRAGEVLRLQLAGGAPVLSRTASLLGPCSLDATHLLGNPTRAEWERAIALLARRADLFRFCWLPEAPGANGWRSDHGRERLLPFAVEEGWAGTPSGARQLVGPLTPEVLAILLAEPPTGLVDLEHIGRWRAGDSPPAPWWAFSLLAGSHVLLHSAENGFSLHLTLTPGEATALDQPPGRLRPILLGRPKGGSPDGGKRCHAPSLA